MTDKIEIGKRYVCRNLRYSVVVKDETPDKVDIRLGLVHTATVFGVGDGPFDETFTRDGHYYHDGEESDYDFGPCLEAERAAAPEVLSVMVNADGSVSDVPEFTDRERLRIEVASRQMATLVAMEHVPVGDCDLLAKRAVALADALLKAAKEKV